MSHSLIVLHLLVSIGFQVLFHSPPGVLFTFPSRYCSSIGHQVVFSLGGWAPLLPTGLLVSGGTLVPTVLLPLSLTGLLPSLAPLSNGLLLDSSDHLRWPSTPNVRRLSVWALSLSLAATQNIDVSFLSSGYLDVSVHRVPYHNLCIQLWLTAHYHRRVSPFGYLRIIVRLQLPAAFRSLPRPSSALDAKAFTLRSS